MLISLGVDNCFAKKKWVILAYPAGVLPLRYII